MRRSPRFVLGAAAASTGAFGLLLLAAYYTGPGRWVDAAALDGFEALQRPWFDDIANRVAHVCNPLPFALLAAGAVALAVALRGLRTGAAAGVLLLGANASSQILKPALAHFRDISQFTHVHAVPAASFPSGHATAAMSLALAAVLIAPRAYRPLVATLGGLFTLAVSFSILALGWHFPSDVFGGYLVATAWGLVVLAGLRAAAARWPQPGTMRKAIAAPSLGALARLGAVAASLAIIAAAARSNDVASFADQHTTFVAVAAAMTVCAAALLAGVTALAGRQR